MRNRKNILLTLLGLAALIFFAVCVYYLPPVHSRLAWRIDDLRARIKNVINPPDEAVFQPSGVDQSTPPPTPTVADLATPSLTPTPEAITDTPGPTLPPTITMTPFPARVSLPGVKYIDQHNRWNYCGPANLAMALTFWGWKGTRDDIAAVVKPGVEDPSLDMIQRGRLDLNVMPYELANYVTDQTDYHIVVRYGGEIDVLKRLIAAGFPVLIEKGYYERDYAGKVGWMGHYLFVTGYDDNDGAFIVQDAYLKPGKNLLSKYNEFIEGWRGFDYLFMVVYPPDREQEVYNLLGTWGDPGWTDQHALDTANNETATLTGIDLFFAWFNKGTSHVQLMQYADAATAYDKAFEIYANLDQAEKDRPYRMMWYQTGPYWAYYYTGRYQDVIDLADTTLSTPSVGPVLEESLYWRGLAENALGDSRAAIKDLKEAVRLNPHFMAAIDKLREWGARP
jgi:tetratricopeptide (TPR) repeat protein